MTETKFLSQLSCGDLVLDTNYEPCFVVVGFGWIDWATSSPFRPMVQLHGTFKEVVANSYGDAVQEVPDMQSVTISGFHIEGNTKLYDYRSGLRYIGGSESVVPSFEVLKSKKKDVAVNAIVYKSDRLNIGPFLYPYELDWYVFRKLTLRQDLLRSVEKHKQKTGKDFELLAAEWKRLYLEEVSCLTVKTE